MSLHSTHDNVWFVQGSSQCNFNVIDMGVGREKKLRTVSEKEGIIILENLGGGGDYKMNM